MMEMPKNWTRRFEWVKTVDDFMESASGVSISALLSPPTTAPEEILNLPAASLLVKKAVAERRPVAVIGDYDVDGITGTAILAMLLRYLGATSPRLVIPRRFSDGYGVPFRAVRDVRDSLIITVDNGITAFDAMGEALGREKNNMVLILDHHLPGENIPDADVVVNPHISPELNGFYGYCGAGLAYKLSELLLRGDSSSQAESLRNTLSVLACIGTVADVVPLIGDNRQIVKNGLERLNCEDRYRLPAGIRAILDLVNEVISEDTIAYQLAPLINAPGRMYDAGGTSTLKALLCRNADTAYEYASKMKKINEERKAAVERWYGVVYAKAMKQAEKCPIVVFQRGIPEGIVGILTGKLAEALKTPCFVFSQAEKGAPVKGSGRSYGGFNLSVVLGSIRDLVLSAGGHQGAAGVAVEAGNYAEMRQRMWACPECQVYTADTALSYDLEVYPEDVPALSEELKPYTPFGEGVPRPVVRVRDATLYSERGSGYMLMGKEQQHLKLFFRDFSAVGFGMAQSYRDAGNPGRLELLGTVSENVFNGRVSVQFQLIDFSA